MAATTTIPTTITNHGTGIEWTHVPGYKGETWNPVRGCVKVSPGCKHCYAETFAERFRGVAGHPYEQGFDLRLVPEKLDEPIRATKPRAYFVNSMSDLFQVGVDFDFIADVFETQARTPQHLYLTLTKRPERMREFWHWTRAKLHKTSDILGGRSESRSIHDVYNYIAGTPRDTPLPNAWLGVSVEDRKHGLPRIDVLRTIPAAVRFLSVEPLIEGLGDIDLTGIHWVIVGGESGANARPMDPAWPLRIRDMCRAQGVPYFFKQWGGIHKKLRGNVLDGRQYLEFPKVVSACV